MSFVSFGGHGVFDPSRSLYYQNPSVRAEDKFPFDVDNPSRKDLEIYDICVGRLLSPPRSFDEAFDINLAINKLTQEGLPGKLSLASITTNTLTTVIDGLLNFSSQNNNFSFKYREIRDCLSEHQKEIPQNLANIVKP